MSFFGWFGGRARPEQLELTVCTGLIKIVLNNEKAFFGIGHRCDARKFQLVQQDLHLQAVC